MKRVMVALMVLLMAGLTISVSEALDIPSFLSTPNTPYVGVPSSLSGVPSGSYGPTTSFGSSAPAAVNPPTQSSFDNWDLNNLKFFSNDNRASATPVSSIPASDYESIMQMLSQLPAPSQAQQYPGAGTGTATASPTPTPTPEQTFQNVSTVIPDDQIIFIEVMRNEMLIDPTAQGIVVPNVTMNYQFSDSKKQLLLRNRPGVSLNGTKIIFGFSDSDDVNNRYLFEYGIGSCPVMDVQVVFAGADGRVTVVVNGEQKNIKPGEKVESISENGGVRTVLDVTNWGLIPKSSVQIKDTL